MENEKLSDISEEQISFRKKRKKGENKDNIFIIPENTNKDTLIKLDSKEILNNKEVKIKKNKKLETLDSQKKIEIKKDNQKDSDSCSSLDIQKVGINSKNTRILGGNKHSIIDLKDNSKKHLANKKVNSKIFLLFSLKAAFTPELVSHLVSNLELVKYNILLFFSCFVFLIKITLCLFCFFSEFGLLFGIRA